MKINFKCPNRIKDEKCDFCDSRGILYKLGEENENLLCGKNKTTECIADSKYVPPLVGEKMSPTNVSKDRAKISKKHFKKEILPTIDSDSQRWHNNKK